MTVKIIFNKERPRPPAALARVRKAGFLLDGKAVAGKNDDAVVAEVWRYFDLNKCAVGVYWRSFGVVL